MNKELWSPGTECVCLLYPEKKGVSDVLMHKLSESMIKLSDKQLKAKKESN